MADIGLVWKAKKESFVTVMGNKGIGKGDDCYDILCKMTKEDLLLIFDDEECYAKELCEMAKEILIHKHGMKEEEIYTTNLSEGFIRQKIMTRDILLKTLAEMGCESISFDNSDNSDDGFCPINFSYLGAKFSTTPLNAASYITIQKECVDFEYRDLKELEKVKDAVNMVNRKGHAIMTYNIDYVRETVYVSCQITVLFLILIPSMADYIYDQLRYLVFASKEFFDCFEYLSRCEFQELVMKPHTNLRKEDCN